MSRNRGKTINLSKAELILIISVAIICTISGYFIANALDPTLVNTIADEVIISMVSSLVTGVVLAVVLKYLSN